MVTRQLELNSGKRSSFSSRDKSGTPGQKRDKWASREISDFFRDLRLKIGTVPGNPGRMVTLNGLGIYLRMSSVVALGSLLVQVTHTESGPASAVVGQGHWTLRPTGGNQSKEWSGNRGARCVHMWVPPACMTRDNWACPRVIRLITI